MSDTAMQCITFIIACFCRVAQVEGRHVRLGCYREGIIWTFALSGFGSITRLDADNTKQSIGNLGSSAQGTHRKMV